MEMGKTPCTPTKKRRKTKHLNVRDKVEMMTSTSPVNMKVDTPPDNTMAAHAGKVCISP